LNSSIIESLYPEELYQIPGSILILLPNEWNEVSAEERNQLSKILAALKLNLASVKILTWKQNSLANVLSFSPTKIICFGVSIAPGTQLYENGVFEGIPFIQADTLNSLDDVKKRTLWLALKSMFGL
jgi:hypothetical protein